jgi:hypothetical protein
LTTTVPAPWCQAIAEELHRIAYDLGNVVNIQGGLPEPSYVQLHIQPSGDKTQQLAAIADLGNAIAGQSARPREMGDGSYHYDVDARRGPVLFRAYTSIDTATALRLIAEDEQAQKDAEIDRLRARVAELEARGLRVAEHYDPAADERVVAEEGKRVEELGLNFTRADDDTVDPTPTGPREPLHTGGMTEDGLVDETNGGFYLVDHGGVKPPYGTPERADYDRDHEFDHLDHTHPEPVIAPVDETGGYWPPSNELSGLIVGDTADEQRDNAYAAYERDEAEYLPTCPECMGQHHTVEPCR